MPGLEAGELAVDPAVAERGIDGLIPGNADNSRRFLRDFQPEAARIVWLRGQPRLERPLRFERDNRQIAPGLCHCSKRPRSAAALRAELGLERRDPRLQRLVLLARQPRHVLDRLELLALGDVEVAQEFLRLMAPERIDLALDALRRARRVVHQAA